MTDRMFCDECGARLVNGKCMACSIDYSSGSPVRMSRPAPAPVHYDPGPAPAPAPAPQPDYSALKKSNDPSNILISTDEEIIATLGNTYAQSFLSTGMIRSSFAVLSNKRLYFKGNMVHVGGAGVSKLNTMQIAKVVDLADITGTSILTMNNVGLIVNAVISFFLAVVSLFMLGVSGYFWIGFFMFGLWGGLMLLLYHLLKTKFMCIEFAGGDITFDMKLFRAGECEDFFNRLRVAKDRALLAKMAKMAEFTEAVRAGSKS